MPNHSNLPGLAALCKYYTSEARARPQRITVSKVVNTYP